MGINPVLKSGCVITRFNITRCLIRPCYDGVAIYVIWIDDKFEVLTRHRMVTFTPKKYRLSPCKIMYAETWLYTDTPLWGLSLSEILRVQCVKDSYSLLLLLYIIHSGQNCGNFTNDKIQVQFRQWQLVICDICLNEVYSLQLMGTDLWFRKWFGIGQARGHYKNQ